MSISSLLERRAAAVREVEVWEAFGFVSASEQQSHAFVSLADLNDLLGGDDIGHADEVFPSVEELIELDGAPCVDHFPDLTA